MAKLPQSKKTRLDFLSTTEILPRLNFLIEYRKLPKIKKNELKTRLKLVDEEGCEFDFVEDSHLCSYSDYSKQSKLRKFYNAELRPKIAKNGALAFELPDYFENLSLGIEDGNIEII